MNLKKQYLYQLITSWRREQGKKLLDLEKLCMRLNVHILAGEEDNMFPSGEIAYYVLYPDGKSCVVIHKKIDEQYHKEILVYSLLRIALLKKYDDKKLTSQLPNGTIMESFFQNQRKKTDDAAKTMMHEVLIPSSEVSISLYRTLNAHKIELLANYFEVRPKLIVERLQELSKNAKGLLYGIPIEGEYQSSILNRYLSTNIF